MPEYDSTSELWGEDDPRWGLEGPRQQRANIDDAPWYAMVIGLAIVCATLVAIAWIIFGR